MPDHQGDGRHRISIHALREEGDLVQLHHRLRLIYFYPRPPRGGRRNSCGRRRLPDRISIPALREEGDLCRPSHTDLRPISIPALREEGDVNSVRREVDVADFYPRPPRGGRPIEGDKTYENIKFLSPPSARRATRQIPLYLPWQGISIPALREEGDERGKNLDPIDLLFLSPPSARRAT